MQGIALGLTSIVDAVVARGATAAGQSAKAGLVIVLLLFLFHMMEGAAELVLSPASCRLWHGKFWLRILLVTAGLGGYQAVVVGTVAKLQPQFMTAYAVHWTEVWVNEVQAVTGVEKAESENKDLKYAEASATKAGKDDDSWYAKLANYVVDGLLTGIGTVLATIVGLIITVLILMEGFTGLGMNMLLLAIGPLCIAFAAHEKTESFFWSFLKAFIFVGLLYMPLLGLSCEFAAIVLSKMTAFVGGSSLSYGDGTDIGVHLVFVLLGPLCALAVVKAAPTFLGMVLGGGSGGGAGGMAMAMGVSTATQVVAGSATGGAGAEAATSGAAAGGGAAGADAAATGGGAAAGGTAGGGSVAASVSEQRGE
jgi:type IV secretory pathway VirB6-like protein